MSENAFSEIPRFSDMARLFGLAGEDIGNLRADETFAGAVAAGSRVFAAGQAAAVIYDEKRAGGCLGNQAALVIVLVETDRRDVLRVAIEWNKPIVIIRSDIEGL